MVFVQISPPSPFIDPDTGAFGRIREEATPIATLVAIVGAMALLPMALVFALGAGTPLALVLTLLAQFIWQ